MRFEWDEEKRRANIVKHGVDFVDAEEIFSGPMLVGLDQREEYYEDRWIGLGLSNGRVLVVVYTEPRQDVLRVISLRKAMRYEQEQFRTAIGD
jgi:uncharacterized protein